MSRSVFRLRVGRSRPAGPGRRRTPLWWLLFGAGLLAAAAVAVTSLPDRHLDSGAHAHTHEHGDAELGLRGPQPDTADAATACQQALSTMFTWQPGRDASPGAGLRRARAWLSGELARDASDTGADVAARAPVEWAAWQRSGDSITATTEIDGVELDDHRAMVSAVVSQLVVHRDGTSTPYRQLRLLASVDHTGQGWRLSSYHSQ